MKNPVLSSNAFVKGIENRMKSKMGDKPAVPAAMKKFDAYMSNNGDEAKRSANKLTSGLEDAFPMNSNLVVD